MGFRQSVQPLNLIVAALRRDGALFLRAIGKTRYEIRCGLLIVGKPETEAAIGGDPDRLAFERDRGARTASARASPPCFSAPVR